MKSISLIILVALSFASCKKSKMSDLNADMIGSWEEVGHVSPDGSQDYNDGQGQGSNIGNMTIGESEITDIGEGTSEYTLDGDALTYSYGQRVYIVSVSGNSMSLSNSVEIRAFEKQ